MNLSTGYGLPFVTATVEYNNRILNLDNVLLDTGSASTIFHVEQLTAIDLRMEPDNMIRRIRGVGGTEFVFGKRVNVRSPLVVYGWRNLRLRSGPWIMVST